MSGHSKWASIKHKKAATDAKRGKIFTRLIKEIMIAAKDGGGDPESNPKLRTAVDSAKSVNMPNDNIKKAILRGTGELEGVNYEDISYEGYGPGGIAILIECLTDNKNRTVAEVRHTLGKYNGNLGESGCVGWMFTKKGLILIEKDKIEEDELLEIVLENGAEDMTDDDDNFAVTTTTETLAQVTDAIKAKIEIISSELSMIPSTYIKLEEKQAHQMLKLLDKLEEIDDIQNVWTNFDIDPEIIESFPG